MLNADLRFYNHPFGKLHIAVHEERIVAVSFAPIERSWLNALVLEPGTKFFNGSLSDLPRQMDTFFSGLDPHFNLKITLHGTPFETAVWKACMNIPYGKTSTYAAIAEEIGSPNAVRAVGTALSANPIPIIVPCHRVVRTDGSLGGFRGGLKLKQQLLDMEKGIE